MHHGINILWLQTFSPQSVGVGPNSRRAQACQQRQLRVWVAWLALPEPFSKSDFTFTNPLTPCRMLTTVPPLEQRPYPRKPVSPGPVRENPGYRARLSLGEGEVDMS